jgi:hypothetical protein
MSLPDSEQCSSQQSVGPVHRAAIARACTHIDSGMIRGF